MLSSAAFDTLVSTVSCGFVFTDLRFALLRVFLGPGRRPACESSTGFWATALIFAERFFVGFVFFGLVAFGFVAFGLAAFGLAAFGLADFGLADFGFADFCFCDRFAFAIVRSL